MLALSAAVLAVISLTSAPAWAVDYPSWQDVQNAKANEASKAAEITRIEGLIADSEAQVAATQAIADQRGAEYQVAQDAFDEADFRANSLQAQADASKVEAEAATARAGLLAAQLYRTGGSDLSTDLMLGGDGQADQFLSKLGQASKLAEINSGLYSAAVETKNAAQALTDQAQVARTEREKLRVEAEAKLAEAAAASQAAQEQLAQQQEMNITLTQQLAALKDATAATTEQYQAGVEERRKAAAAAAAASGASGDYGQLSDQGWARPGSGRITDNFGPRPSQPAGANAFHRGTDLGTGCSAPIYAATGGTVIYAGPNGTYGNFVLIDHGSGVSTGYAHIRAGGIFVNVGQWVDAGQNIASTGSTGASTACHLHFEVRINGTAIDAVPFMRDRGAPLG
ncbi:M23 family metallopeptidase [Amnibacterium flavum]|uniref:M23 family metallopeptidase n=1 Tax=Amnibacterium flavum TaxID=2173173 RepID=UPI001F0B8B3E|nr:M23 family metallopeptidase [Amnibacterium flavum]